MRRRRISPVLQTAESDCAPACLVMMLGWFGRETSLFHVRELIDPGRDGATAGDLRDVARSFGLQPRALRLDPSVMAEPNSPLRSPFVAHWRGNHFIVVEHVGKRWIHIVDPAVGRRRINRAEFLEHATGVVIAFNPTTTPPSTEVTPERYKRTQPSRLILGPLINRHRGRLATTIVVSLVLTGFGFIVPAATAAITDALSVGRSPSQVWLLVAVMLALATGVLALSRGLTAASLQQGMSRDLTLGTAGQLFESSYRYFERRNTGDLFMRIASADMIRELLGVGLVGSLLDTILATGYLAVVAVFSPVLAATTAGVLFIQLGFVLLLAARSRSQRREELLAGADADSVVVDAIAGIATIRTCAAERTVLGRWSTLVERRLDASRRRSRTIAISESLTTTVRLAAPIVFLLVAATQSQTPGSALGLAALATSSLAPLTSLSTRLVGISELRPLLERILDVVHSPREPGSINGIAAPDLTGEIELVDTGFRYTTRSAFVFRHLNVLISPGMKVAVVGPTGCGKSTLVSLLTGLHEPSEGHLLFDGHDVTALQPASLRGQIGVVLQDPYLGIGTIRDAITLGRSDVSDEEVHRVARVAALHDEIMAMPHGYDTRVGEGGRGVSGGQRQRIALARALVGAPAVLIFDEATSALDVATEAIIEHELRTLNMTRIVIAHRLSTIVDADLILVMFDGSIAEMGSPAELLDKNGLYASLMAQHDDRRGIPITPKPRAIEPGTRYVGRHRINHGPDDTTHPEVARAR